jgi:DNA-binding transcriptional regulator YiaG
MTDREKAHAEALAEYHRIRRATTVSVEGADPKKVWRIKSSDLRALVQRINDTAADGDSMSPDQLREFREDELRLSRPDFAMATGFSPIGISQWEQGVRTIPVHVIRWVGMWRELQRLRKAISRLQK